MTRLLTWTNESARILIFVQGILVGVAIVTLGYTVANELNDTVYNSVTYICVILSSTVQILRGVAQRREMPESYDTQKDSPRRVRREGTPSEEQLRRIHRQWQERERHS